MLELRLYPDPILEKSAEEVTDFSKPEELQALIKEMHTLMYAAKGIGLAAPQVGISKKILVFGGNPEKGVTEGYIINPGLIVSSGGKEFYEEGCLSFPGLSAKVERWREVQVHGKNFKGEDLVVEGKGLLAIVLQHEMDHLLGVTFLDYLSKLKRDIMKKKMVKYKKTLTLDKFKQLFVEEMLKRQNENDSAGPGGDANHKRG